MGLTRNKKENHCVIIILSNFFVGVGVQAERRTESSLSVGWPVVVKHVDFSYPMVSTPMNQLPA